MEQIATQANHVNRSFIDRPYVELISSPSMNALEGLFAGVRSELHIVSPYITSMGTAVITDRVRPVARRLSIRLHLLTDLNPLSVCQGSCDPDAILGLVRAFPRARIRHLPRVHAKVFVADRKIAIVGSANLTEGGLRDNYEYSIKVKSPEVASRVALDVEEYSNLGASVRVEVLESYSRAAIALRKVFGKKERATSSSIRKAFDAHLQTGSELLLRALVREGVTRVFSRTILFLLRAGPLRTADIHPQIKRIHPDLCDDSVDRVIDGERFGKRWKHLVRTAQQILKREGLVEIDGGFWRLSRSAGV
jgi:hypothetical protein